MLAILRFLPLMKTLLDLPCLHWTGEGWTELATCGGRLLPTAGFVGAQGSETCLRTLPVAAAAFVPHGALVPTGRGKAEA